jgi:nitrite reductase/ring-hydroxylating ferredoxin subunit
MAKVAAGKASEIPNGKMVGVQAGGKEILVANVDGKYYAMGNICNHAGANLHEGELSGKEVTCPWHGSKWDVTNGNLTWFPTKLKQAETFKVAVEGDTVYVEV